VVAVGWLGSYAAEPIGQGGQLPAHFSDLVRKAYSLPAHFVVENLHFVVIQQLAIIGGLGEHCKLSQLGLG